MSYDDDGPPWLLIILGSIVAFVLVCVLVVVGWQVGWWFKNQNVNRQALIFQNSYGTQSALIGELNQEIQQFDGIQVQVASPQTPGSEKSALVSQEQGIINQACPQVGQISIRVPTNIRSWANVYCSN